MININTEKFVPINLIQYFHNEMEKYLLPQALLMDYY
jgi:hypothetical protein